MKVRRNEITKRSYVCLKCESLKHDSGRWRVLDGYNSKVCQKCAQFLKIPKNPSNLRIRISDFDL